jgi:hypothetical protein
MKEKSGKVARKPANPCAARVSAWPLLFQKWAKSGQMASFLAKIVLRSPFQPLKTDQKVGRWPVFRAKVASKMTFFQTCYYLK